MAMMSRVLLKNAVCESCNGVATILEGGSLTQMGYLVNLAERLLIFLQRGCIQATGTYASARQLKV